MKILLSNKFFFLNGGSERVFFQEREFLSEKISKVIDFSMLNPRNLESRFSTYFVKNINYESGGGIGKRLKTALSFVYSNEAVAKLEKLLEIERPDIAHLHNIYHQLTPAIIPIFKHYGAKVVLTLHDYKLICPSYLALSREEICTACEGTYFWNPITRNCQGSLSKGLLLSIEAFFHKWQKSYEKVDLFLSPSQFLAGIVHRRVPMKKIQVLHNGIDIHEYIPNFDDEGFILYLGRISKEKGIETLLQAHESLGAGVPLKIVGTGALLEPLKTRFSKANFLGYKSGCELYELIRNAAFVVVPSEWYENCPMVVLEAMAAGKPVIGSRIGGIPELIEDRITGFLFEMGNVEELADRMLKLWIDQEMRVTMGRAARAKVENEYSLANHCNSLLAIYEQVLSA